MSTHFHQPDVETVFLTMTTLTFSLQDLVTGLKQQQQQKKVWKVYGILLFKSFVVLEQLVENVRLTTYRPVRFVIM